VRFKYEPPRGGAIITNVLRDAKDTSRVRISCETVALRRTLSMIRVSVAPTTVFLPCIGASPSHFPLVTLLEGPNLNFLLLKSSPLDGTKLRESNMLLDSVLT
jgi:hypothetical protein